MSGKYGELIRRAHNETSESLDVQDTQMSKTKDPNYTRTTIYLPKILHRKLKAKAAEEGREMSEIVEKLIGDWLKAQD